MTINTTHRIGILRDLENIYTLAMEKGNFAAALKAKELLGREYGLFSHKVSSSRKTQVSLGDLSEEDIKRLMGEIEKQLSLDRKDGDE